MNSERHPLQPFLPPESRILLLGSFPPQRKRWSMEFFYPNLQNDMWRVVGWLFFGDRDHFLTADRKAFDRAHIERFCRVRGIAIYDTSEEVILLKNNASDASLQVVREVDLEALLAQIPTCRTIVATGGKSAETLSRILGCELPAVGEWTPAVYADRELQVWRMPSTSRAFPRPVEWKAEFYRRVFSAAGIL